MPNFSTKGLIQSFFENEIWNNKANISCLIQELVAEDPNPKFNKILCV